MPTATASAAQRGRADVYVLAGPPCADKPDVFLAGPEGSYITSTVMRASILEGSANAADVGGGIETAS